MKEKLLISACFLKSGFKYDGTDNFNEKILKLQEKYEFILICPEVDGGLAIPRLPSECKDGKVINKIGQDVTENFNKGASKALEVELKNHCKKALLKAKSPSCGKGVIYDGTFTHTKTLGNGVACELLIRNGIKVFTEDELEQL